MKKDLGWLITPDETDYEGGDIHVIPLNDLREHVEESWCACLPRTTDETERGRMLMHNAFDEREVVEQLFEEVGLVDRT